MKTENEVKYVWIKTFGCQMNYHDSERLLAHLLTIGYQATEQKEKANLILFNTCAIRDLANLKFYSQLGEIRRLKENNPDLLVGIAGCVSQTDGDKLLKKYKFVDFAFGTDVIDQIVSIINRVKKEKSALFVNQWDFESEYSIETKITHGNPQAFVNIIKGCNNYCSYCVVPYTRGREKSRRMSEIVTDVTSLVKEHSISEVTLLGQNVNSFGKEYGESLAMLLEQLEKIEGLELIRYTTSHPKDMSEELIQAHGKIKKLANHLHLPVQSGSNSVLDRMNRKHTIEHYLELLKKLRQVNPSLVISSDLIVGFPGETEEEFFDTMKLLELAQYDFIYSYKYSPREGTKAFSMSGQVDSDTKKKRLYALQQKQLEIQKSLRMQMVGKVYRILVEGKDDKKGVLKWMGRSSCNRIIHFLPEDKNQDYQWKWVNVEVFESTALSSQGRLITG